MRGCPVCQTTDTYAAHRQGWLERGPLTWCGILPFRCEHCQTRFFRWALRDPRRRHHLNVAETVTHMRAPRWESRSATKAIIRQPGKSPITLAGEIEDRSADGVRVRLPAEAPVGCRIRVTVGGGGTRSGTVRWVKPHEGAWFSHGVGFDAPAGRRGITGRQVRRFRRRQRVRRALFWFVALGVIALTTAGLVWVLEALRNYQPQYYEPKDIERERHETQRRLEDAKSRPSR
jgi:hypothetical protein